MIGIEQWRAVVGCFSPKIIKTAQPLTTINSTRLKHLFRHRRVGALFLVGALLLMCGDVEQNPGPPKKVQSKLTTEIGATNSPGRQTPTQSAPPPDIADVMTAIKHLGFQFDDKFSALEEKVSGVATTLTDL